MAAMEAASPSIVAMIFFPVALSLSIMAQPSGTTPPGELIRMSMVSSSSGMEAMNSSMLLNDTPSKPIHCMHMRSSSGIMALYTFRIMSRRFY